MKIKERLEAFIELGKQINALSENTLANLTIRARAENSWFTEDNIKNALVGIAYILHEEKLYEWVNNYEIKDQQLKVGVVMAGNIPLVGFHDLLTVLISGNKLLAKLSSNDRVLMSFIIDTLISINSKFKEFIEVRERLNDMDAVIATGSDNSSRYFDYYFSKYPHVIRKNKTSAAILTGNETSNDLKSLGKDIFLYYGLGCRNVSKLYIPNGYNFNNFFEGIALYEDVIHHHKYNNNYDYNKSIYLVNGIKHYDNGFLMLKEDEQMVSPISVLYYEYYDNLNNLKDKLNTNEAKIQCIVGKLDNINSKAFGDAQLPAVNDYADNIDTMSFLVNL